jgi:hypothetical protein
MAREAVFPPICNEICYHRSVIKDAVLASSLFNAEDLQLFVGRTACLEELMGYPDGNDGIFLLWSKNLSPFLEGLAIGEFQLASLKIATIKRRPPKMKNPAVSNSFSPSGASDLTPPPGGNT